MIPGLGGEIHDRTGHALAASLVGGFLSGYTLAESHPAVFVAMAAVAAYAPLYIVPDADTVATEWIVRQDREEGSP